MGGDDDTERDRYRSALCFFFRVIAFFRHYIRRAARRFCQVRPLGADEGAVGDMASSARIAGFGTRDEGVIRGALRCNDL